LYECGTAGSMGRSIALSSGSLLANSPDGFIFYLWLMFK
jgi:hypothetical protein